MRVFLSVLGVLLSLALLAGTVYTMVNKVEGWGWLAFLLFISIYGTYEVISQAIEKNP